MTEKQKDELLKHVVGAIGAIRAQFEVEVIKDYVIPSLVNTKTGKDIGLGVKLQLNTRYDYDEEMLSLPDSLSLSAKWAFREIGGGHEPALQVRLGVHHSRSGAVP